MAEINSQAWWDNRCMDYIKKNDLRIRTEEDAAAARCVTGTIIEIGCAFGGFSNSLLPNVQYLGIDISAAMIHKARQFYPERIFIRQSLEEAVGSMKKAFTTACAFQLLEHFSDVNVPLGMLSQIARKRIIFTVPRGLPQNHQRDNDGHVVGWKDDDAVRAAFKPFGAVSLWKGNDNHICGVINLKAVKK